MVAAEVAVLRNPDENSWRSSVTTGQRSCFRTLIAAGAVKHGLLLTSSTVVLASLFCYFFFLLCVCVVQTKDLSISDFVSSSPPFSLFVPHPFLPLSLSHPHQEVLFLSQRRAIGVQWGTAKKPELSSGGQAPCSAGFPLQVSVLGTHLYQCTNRCCERLCSASVNFFEDSTCLSISWWVI